MSFTSRWGDVYLAAGARAVSSCGDVLAATALALALQQAGAGGLAISGLLLAAGLPLVALAPITGRIADRADSRTILVVAGFAQAAVCVALAFARQPALVIVLVALLACGLAVTQPTLAALLPEMVRRVDLAKASGINQTAGQLGMLAAPALAGLLVGQFGVRLPMLLDAGTYLALVAAGLLLRTRRGGATAGPLTRAAKVVGDAWRLRDDRLVAVMVGAMAAVVAGVGAINVIDVFFVRETLGASTTMYGLVSATYTGGVVLGALSFGRLGGRWTDTGRLVQIVMVLLACTCAAILSGAAAWTALVLLPLWLIGGFFNGGLNVFVTVVMANRVPARARGRAFAAMGAAVQGAGMAGFLVGGVLVDRFDPRLLVAGSGGAGLVAVLLCLPVVLRTVRRERRQAATAGDGGEKGPWPTAERPVHAGDSVGA
jgi:MFS family permease